MKLYIEKVTVGRSANLSFIILQVGNEYELRFILHTRTYMVCLGDLVFALLSIFSTNSII